MAPGGVYAGPSIDLLGIPAEPAGQVSANAVWDLTSSRAGCQDNNLREFVN